MGYREKRVEFHNKLKKIVDNVYFQQGDKMDIKYPCIIYSRQSPTAIKANNHTYLRFEEFDVTLIERSDTDLYEKLEEQFHNVNANRFYVEDGMYHKTFTIKY